MNEVNPSASGRLFPKQSGILERGVVIACAPGDSVQSSAMSFASTLLEDSRQQEEARIEESARTVFEFRVANSNIERVV